ncbi:MAG: SPFH domain-containing protein [Planctomycetota bacterium]|nr:SPFH domain-containing protein [Planctomycetota bacterium]
MVNPLLVPLLAANDPSTLGNIWIYIVVAVVLVFMVILLTLAKQYKRCPSNKILVVYGKVKAGRSSSTYHGGGSFVWPLIQNYAYLSLDPMQIEIPLKGALSAENIRVNVPSVFTVAIGTRSELMQNAAIRLLGLTTKEITHQASDIIFGQLRQVIASMPIEQINRDRDTFLHKIQENLEPELMKIGLVLINVNITDITDGSGYIEALGKKAASEAIQQAQIDVADQVKHGAIGVADADREQQIQVANANKFRDIGTQEAERDKAVSIAELVKEKQVAEQTARYETETQVKDSERAMRVSIASANANAVTGENEARAQIATSNAELQVKEAEAYLVGESRKREAAAEVEARQFMAEAKAAESEASKIEAERRAEVEAPARANKAMVVVNAEAEAERRKIEADGRAEAVRLEADGEAHASFARLEARARGEYEILAKKADGLRDVVAACGDVQGAFQLLMLEHLDHLAETSSRALSNIKFDKITVWDSGNGKGGTAGFLQSLGRSLPPLLDIMKNLGGVELPQYFGKMVEETKDGEGAENGDSRRMTKKDTKKDGASVTQA